MPGTSRKNYTKLLIVIIYLILFFALFLGIISSIRLNDISENINQLSQDHDVDRSIIKEFQFRFDLADSYAFDFMESSKQGNLLLFQQSYADLTAFIDENKDKFETPKKRELLDLLIIVISDYEKAFIQYEEAIRAPSNNNSDDIDFFASQIEIYKNDIFEKINNLSSEVDREIVNHTIKSQDNINKTRVLLALLIIMMVINGPLSGWVIIRQSNERARQQKALQDAKIEYDQKLNEQKIELSKANQETKQFAYIVSHDLRASLINLKGFAKELAFSIDQIHPIITNQLSKLESTENKKVSLAINQDIPEAMNYINNSVNRMESFINAVLKLSRLGRRELELVEIDPNPMVEEIVANLTYQLEVRQGAVYAQNLPKIFADQTSMEQIFANILDNATKYWYQGRPLEIHITAKQKNEETIFAIRDNGRGIAKEDMDKVFAPFRRIGTSQELGEGMGMAYVQAIIRNMGGRIWVESEISKGTTIFFTIPKKPIEEKANE
jgi:signal transduction histidine kinase